MLCLSFRQCYPLPVYLHVWIETSLLIYLYIHGEVYPEDGGSTFPRNISKCLKAYTNSAPGQRGHSAQTPEEKTFFILYLLFRAS